MKRITVLTLAAIGLAGCATPMHPQPVGGSRADATVDLMYEFDIFHKPIVNEAEAGNTAAQRCAAWGYTAAQPFGGQKQNCLSQNAYGNCLRMQVTTTYQCIGTGTPPTPPAGATASVSSQ